MPRGSGPFGPRGPKPGEVRHDNPNLCPKCGDDHYLQWLDLVVKKGELPRHTVQLLRRKAPSLKQRRAGTDGAGPREGPGIDTEGSQDHLNRSPDDSHDSPDDLRQD